MARFCEVFDDVTKQGTKIPSDLYLKEGTHPIIDQGQADIVGYTDITDGLFTDVPAIIFGDHTRIIKYVDVPCFLGADGVKLLKAKSPNSNYKYLYYALCNAKIPDTGYNRHFKWLKEVEIRLPPQDEQQNIVVVLDKLGALISLRKQQLAELDKLVKARFVEMFGDPADINTQWKLSSFGERFFITSGGTPPTSKSEFWDNGTISWIGSNMCQDCILYENDGKFITELGLDQSSAKVFGAGTVLIALVGATIGKAALLRFSTATNQNVAAVDVVANKQFTSEFVFYVVQFLYSKFQEIGSGKFKMANQGFIRDLPVICPPIDLQNGFSIFVRQIERQKLTIQQGLDKLEMLKKSLMQEYFG